MGVLDYLKDRSSEFEYLEQKNEAWEEFNKLILDVSKISQTDWYNAIKEYWTREASACEQRLRTMTGDNFKSVQAELNLAKRFTDWLETIETAKTL